MIKRIVDMTSPFSSRKSSPSSHSRGRAVNLQHRWDSSYLNSRARVTVPGFRLARRAVLATPLARLWNQAAPAQGEVAGSAQAAAAVSLDPHSDGALLFASQATGREENIMLTSAVPKNTIVRCARRSPRKSHPRQKGPVSSDPDRGAPFLSIRLSPETRGNYPLKGSISLEMVACREGWRQQLLSNSRSRPCSPTCLRHQSIVVLKSTEHR